jgi:hypothetical protein
VGVSRQCVPVLTLLCVWHTSSCKASNHGLLALWLRKPLIFFEFGGLDLFLLQPCAELAAACDVGSSSAA